MLADTQRGFAAHLLCGEAGIEESLRPGLPAARLCVYRNTVMGSLAAVLGQAYPTVRRALGEDRFTALACRFAAENPPRRPMLWSYGGDLPGWLEAAGDALPPWAPDLARLDRAMHEALFAADADPLDPARLASVPPDRVDTLRLVLHPSVRLILAGWSVHSLWKDPDAVPRAEPEAVLVGRTDGEVRCARLDPADGALAAALITGRTLADAAVEGGPEGGGDLQAMLLRLLHNRLVVGYALDAGPMEG